MNEEMFRRFCEVFPTEPVPVRPITGHRCEECDETDRLMGGRPWPDVAADFSTYCYGVFPLLNEDAKLYYMPVYMLSALGPRDGVQGISVENALIEGQLPVSLFTAKQRAAVIAWLDQYTNGEADWMGPEWFQNG